jgi:hypothetical protein
MSNDIVFDLMAFHGIDITLEWKLAQENHKNGDNYGREKNFTGRTTESQGRHQDAK